MKGRRTCASMPGPALPAQPAQDASEVRRTCSRSAIRSPPFASSLSAAPSALAQHARIAASDSDALAVHVLEQRLHVAARATQDITHFRHRDRPTLSQQGYDGL